MHHQHKNYKALISADWNECLAPCGPFDFISFSYPQLATELEGIFKQYTGNFMSLGQAARRIQQLLPAPIAENQMDRYLEEAFASYKGVPELIKWCQSQNILFMINTTGMIGYFQRIFVKNLMPEVPLLSAHPMVRYPKSNTDPHHVYDLFETTDKGKHTEAAMRLFNIPANNIILMGDSGGDGPHFKWGIENNAYLIANMAKPSLKQYCNQKKILIHTQFGLSYTDGQTKDLQKEMQVDYMDLVPIIEDFLNR